VTRTKKGSLKLSRIWDPITASAPTEKGVRFFGGNSTRFATEVSLALSDFVAKRATRAAGAAFWAAPLGAGQGIKSTVEPILPTTRRSSTLD
jgi:hypothetical protein